VTAFGLFAGAAIALAFMVGHLAIFLLVLVLLTGFFVWHRHDDVPHLLVLGSIAGLLAMSIVGNRMRLETWTAEQNIAVQFSYASWLLLATVAPPIVVLAARAGWKRDTPFRMGGKRLLTAMWLFAIAIFIGAGAVYPALGYPDRLDDRLAPASPTLDAFAFMESGQLSVNANNAPVAPFDLASDHAAVDWMRNNLSGFPTVIGVTSVQHQQRPGMERLVDWRYADVTEIYGSEQSFAEIEPLLRDYGVQIIYVGMLERATYSMAALAKFDEAVTDGMLEVLYQEDGVTIYFHGGPRDSREPFDR
jgi:uncharacterized membrane protein